MFNFQNDLHNISQDSGLSHSPIQQEVPQLTIGNPIKHIDNLAHRLKVGQVKEKGSRWNLGGLFKKRSEKNNSELTSELSDTGKARSRGDNIHKKVTNNNLVLPERNAAVQQTPPPLPPKNSNIFQPTMQVRGGPIFPQLQADIQYPEPGHHIVQAGYYYDPRFGYVRQGSYYDQQIAAMTGHERMSRESTLSHDRSSGVHSMTRSSVHSSVHSDTSSLETTRSWRDQKQVILRNAEQRRSTVINDGDSDTDNESVISGRAQSLSRVSHGMSSDGDTLRRAGSVGSLSKRSRAARTERYLHRKSKDEELIVSEGVDDKFKVDPHNATNPSPYIHTAAVTAAHLTHNTAHRSLSADTQNTKLLSTPPQPPPRDPRIKNHLMSQMRCRPVSYSFEHLRVPSTSNRPSSQNSHRSHVSHQTRVNNNIPLPPRRPSSSHLSQSDQYLGIPRVLSPANTAPVQSDTIVHSTPVSHYKYHQTESQPSLHNFVDSVPRSRKPINFNTTGSNASSEGIGSQTSLEENYNHHLSSPVPPSYSTTMLNRTITTDKRVTSDKTGTDAIKKGDNNDATDNRVQHNNHVIIRDTVPTPSRAKSMVISGKCSPSSVSSKDSGCSASSDIYGHVTHSSQHRGYVDNTAVNSATRSDDFVAGFSTQKRRSRFEEAIKELEVVYNNIANDEDLLDRAERRDLPTAHQLLIWKDRESDTNNSHNTSAESAVSDFDNFLNWNTSSSFEHISGISGLVSPVSRMRTPSTRRSGVSDKVSDDMAVRRISAANKVPRTLSSLSELGNTSYLSVTPGHSTSCVELSSEWDPDEPDVIVDDVRLRNIRDANQIKVIEPQPKFGVPLGPISGGANSDYLHAVPDGKYRSTFNSMRNPDLVKDDLAFRHLRKDENLLEDPSQLGIVKDPHGLISPTTNWPPNNQETRRSPPIIYYPNKNNQIMRSLSGNIAQIIKKQSCRPGARLDDIITYQHLNNPLVYDSMKYTMDLINTQTSKPLTSSKSNEKIEKYGTTVYDLLRQHKSEPENISNDDQTVIDPEHDLSDEGVSSVSSPDLSSMDTCQLPDVVTTDHVSHDTRVVTTDHVSQDTRLAETQTQQVSQRIPNVSECIEYFVY